MHELLANYRERRDDCTRALDSVDTLVGKAAVGRHAMHHDREREMPFVSAHDSHRRRFAN